MNPHVERVARRYVRAKIAGTETRTIRGHGWTQQEALDNAMAEDERMYGHGEGYGGGWHSVRKVLQAKQVKAPKKPTKVTITKTPVDKGPVKKVYRIQSFWGRSSDGLARDRRFTTQYPDGKTALEAAKALALQYGEELTVELAPVCSGNTLLARVKPEKGELGEWVFTVDFAS